MKAFGRIDVLVNNAGYSLLGNFEELSTAEIDKLIATNFYGVMYVMRAVLATKAVPFLRFRMAHDLFRENCSCSAT